VPFSRRINSANRSLTCIFKLELLAIAEPRPAALVTQSCDPHYLQIAIENWLTGTNSHILNPAELVHTHQIQQGTLFRAQVLSPPEHSEPWDRLY
jgi:hypothetical protein